MSLFDEIRLDTSVTTLGTLDDEGDDRACWRQKTPQERLEVSEWYRQVACGYDPETARLQRVLEFAERSWG